MIAALALSNARRYVERVEGRMERFRAEQNHLLASLHKELRRSREEAPLREREEHPASQRRVEHLSQECLRLRQEKAQLAEELERERVKREEAQQRVRQEREGRELERRARREAERRIDRYNREVKGIPLKEVPQENREVSRETPLPVLEGPSDGKDLAAALYLTEKPLSAQRASQGSSSHEAEGPPRPAVTPPKEKKMASEPREGWPGEERPRLARWIPHPDDGGGASKGWASTGQERSQQRSQQRGQSGPQSNDDSVEMFRRHYDKYLESYEGYLELIEMLHRMREGGGMRQPGSFGEHEWENRLRRAYEGIKRTNVRLDTLEEYHPELATDDRVARRAGLARRHSELEQSGHDRTRP